MFSTLWMSVGAIVLVWAVFSLPYFRSNKVPFPSTYLMSFFTPWAATGGMPVKNNAMPDVITQIYPWKRLTIETYAFHSIPLWNPNSFSGTSHIGNYQSAVLSPINLLFAVLPEIDAWSLLILLQPLFAGIGMYLFLYALDKSTNARIIGSVAYMFCGFLVVWMAYGTLGYAVGVLPYILWGIVRYTTTARARYMLAVPLGIAFSLFSGHFQMSVYVLMYAGAFAVFMARQAKSGNKGTMAYLLLAIIVGVAIASPQLLPAFDAYMAAGRSALFTKGEIIPWSYLITLFSPDFYGNPVTRNDWFGHYAEWAGYIGVIPLYLSLIALFGARKHRIVRFMSVSAVLSILLAYNTPLVDLLYALKIPVLSTSSASRIIILASFSLSTLAAFGYDRLIDMWKHSEYRFAAIASFVSLAVLTSIWMVILFMRPFDGEKLSVALRNSVLPSVFLCAGMFMTWVGFLRKRHVRTIATIALVTLVAFDLFRFASKWIPFDPREFVYPELPVVRKLVELTSPAHERIFGNVGNEGASPFGLQLIEGYDAVYQNRYGRFISAVADGTIGATGRSVVQFPKNGVYAQNALDLLGVRFYMHKKSDGRLPWAYPFWEYPQYERRWEDENFEILENTTSYPRAFLASGYEIVTDEQEAITRLFSKEFDRRHTLLLETTPDIVPASGSGRVMISLYRPNEVELRVSSTVNTLVFLSDVYDPGWRAYRDGKRVPLFRADVVFRAVAVPEGEHTIRMVYLPISFVRGVWISALSLLALGAYIVWNKRNY